MGKYEEKYKLFGLNDEMTKLFKKYVVGLYENEDSLKSFTIKTIIIDKTETQVITLENGSAKLV